MGGPVVDVIGTWNETVVAESTFWLLSPPGKIGRSQVSISEHIRRH
jgi:hypothetical protein